VSEYRGWMVCGESGEPCNWIVKDSEEEAMLMLRAYPPNCGYHVRPVRVSIEVLDQPPLPWAFRAPTPEGADGR
jgi:hypothetical protein